MKPWYLHLGFLYLELSSDSIELVLQAFSTYKGNVYSTDVKHIWKLYAIPFHIQRKLNAPYM